MPIRLLDRVEIAIDRTHPTDKLCLREMGQDQGDLCWAACTWMILDYYGVLNGDRLCNVVEKMTDLTSCCGSNGSIQDHCNTPMDFDAIEDKWWNIYGLDSTYLAHSLSDPDDVFEELNTHKRPLMILRNVDGDIEHAVIIYGWELLNGTSLQLWIFDPADAIPILIAHQTLLDTWLQTYWKLPHKDSGGNC